MVARKIKIVSTTLQSNAPKIAQINPRMRCGFAGFQNCFSILLAENEAHNAASEKGKPMIGSNPSRLKVKHRKEPLIILILAVALSFTD